MSFNAVASTHLGCTSSNGWVEFAVVAPSLSLNLSTWSPVAAGGTQDIIVTSNQSWTVASSPSWLTLSQTGGTNNGSFTMTATANTTGSSRSATITVTGGGISRTLTVSQAAGRSCTGNPSVDLNMTELNNYCTWQHGVGIIAVPPSPYSGPGAAYDWQCTGNRPLNFATACSYNGKGGNACTVNVDDGGSWRCGT